MVASVLRGKLRSLKGGRCRQSAHTPCAQEPHRQTARWVPEVQPASSSEPDSRTQSDELLSLLFAPRDLYSRPSDWRFENLFPNIGFPLFDCSLVTSS